MMIEADVFGGGGASKITLDMYKTSTANRGDVCFPTQDFPYTKFKLTNLPSGQTFDYAGTDSNRSVQGGSGWISVTANTEYDLSSVMSYPYIRFCTSASTGSETWTTIELYN